jgi:hypothetical protein
VRAREPLRRFLVASRGGGAGRRVNTLKALFRKKICNSVDQMSVPVKKNGNATNADPMSVW